MNIILLIIIYALFCISMILFNIGLMFYNKINNSIINKKTDRLKQLIKEQIDIIDNGLHVEEKHLKYLNKYIKNGNNLIIFDQIIDMFIKKENPNINMYLSDLKDIFIDLIYYYDKKNDTEKAYYFSVIKDYDILFKNSQTEIIDILFNSLHSKNFYCRDNAYLVICKIGDTKKIVDALLEISESNKFFHKNLIKNGLTLYEGDPNKLLDKLIKMYNKFRNDIKCCIIEYASYYSGNDNYNVFFLDQLESNSKDIKISCLYYFECVKYDLALESILKNVNSKDFDVSYSAIKSLRNYNKQESIEMLKKSVKNSHLKIRDIACESLAVIRLGLSSKDIIELVSADEADDMYNYHIRKNMKKMVK